MEIGTLRVLPLEPKSKKDEQSWHLSVLRGDFFFYLFKILFSSALPKLSVFCLLLCCFTKKLPSFGSSQTLFVDPPPTPPHLTSSRSSLHRPLTPSHCPLPSALQLLPVAGLRPLTLSHSPPPPILVALLFLSHATLACSIRDQTPNYASLASHLNLIPEFIWDQVPQTQLDVSHNF